MKDIATFRYHNTSNRRIDHYGVTYGVPLREGALPDFSSGELGVRLPDGTCIPIQAKVTQRWADGSIRWLVCDFEMPLDPNERGELSLVSGLAAAPQPELTCTETDETVVVSNAHLEARIGRQAFSVFESLVVDGKDMLEDGGNLVVETPNGKRFYGSFARDLEVSVLENGPQRVVIESRGRHTAEDDSELLSFRLRYTFRPHDPCICVSYKITNMEHPEKGVHISRITLELPTALGPRTVKHVRQTVHGADWHPRPVEIRENVELQAGSHISEMASAVYGNMAMGKVVIRNLESFKEDLNAYPHYLRPGNLRTDMGGGLRAAYPFLGAVGAGGSFIGWFREMEVNYPKAVSCDRNLVRFDIWPQWADTLRLNRGMSKEHDILLSFDSEKRSFEELESRCFDHEVMGKGIAGQGTRPVDFTIDPNYARECRALGIDQWLPYDEDRYLKVEMKIGATGAKGEAGNRGMLDIGDSIIRDCSGNNENDSILKRLREYYRRGLPHLLQDALTAAQHNAHVDLIAYDPDPLRQGTMPAHCPNHTDGAAYPSHMWVGGLLAAYCITGNPDFEEAALSVGENMLRWQKLRPGILYADSREAGWPMLAWVQLWHHTHEQRWLDAAEKVFRFYRDKVDENGEILYEIPHGVGTFLMDYGGFMTWRACYFYWEATGREDVKEFLDRCLRLDSISKLTPARLARGGWACNDLFPAWAAWQITGDEKFLTQNYPFLRFMMEREGNFPWAGVDVMYYLKAVHERGDLDSFC